MPWTDPATWTVGELVLASKMNTHIRDNLNATLHPNVFKSADETVNNSTTLQNDDHLFLSVGTTDVWWIQTNLVFNDASVGTADLKVAFTFPAGGTLALTCFFFNGAGTATMTRWTVSGTGADLQATNIDQAAAIIGTYIGGGTAGTLQLQWAQNTLSATNLIMRKGSNMMGIKLA